MKKRIRILLCLVLLGMAFGRGALPVGAAGTAHMRISSSAATLYRGDIFTLTVSLTNESPVSNGGVLLSYDSNAFAFLDGSCHVSNAALAEVSAANGGGVFVLQTDAVVSGTIFTIRMQVKDNAPFGSYSISGTPSLSVSCGISGTGVTVACRHSFGGWTNTDGDNHESSCTVCGQKQTEAHTWDGGAVLKEANCKETGLKKLTCTGCGTVKEEAIPVSDSHTYGSWTQSGETEHSRSCTLCGKAENGAHNWNWGVVIQAATCQQTGILAQSCVDCGREITTAIPVAAHSYQGATGLNAAEHKLVCTVCGQETTEAHVFGEAPEHDESGHFYSCTICKYEKDRADHIPGPEATETEDQVCTLCGRVLKPRGAHEHDFAEAWITDDSGHWHSCSGCDDRDSLGSHIFDSDCDTQCNVCRFERLPAHKPASEWTSDATGHWHICAGCGEKLDAASHTPGEAATITAAQICTLCQFEIAPKLPHEHTFDGQGTLHRHSCACGETYEASAKDCAICAPFPWWILCVAEAALFGAVIIMLVLRMRRRR